MKKFFMPSGFFHIEIALSKQKQSKEEEKSTNREESNKWN